MQVEIPPQITSSAATASSAPNEQILRLMQSLGIDISKTREVRRVFVRKQNFFKYTSFQSIRSGSYDHHAAIYYLLLERLRTQLGGMETREGGREVQRRRPSSIAEQAMRKIGRANTTEDCRRLLHHSTTVPSQHLASNCDVTYTAQQQARSKTETSDSPSSSFGIDTAKLLATTNSEDAIKILQQSTTTTFTMSSEASKLMSTLQLSPLPPTCSTQEKIAERLPESHYSDLSRVQSNTPPFKDFMNHLQTYAYMQNAFTCQTSESSIPPVSGDTFSSQDSKCSLSRFTPITSSVCYSGDIQTQYSSSTDEGCETDLEDAPAPRLSYASSSSSSGVVTNFNNSKSLSQNLSRDSSQSNFSTFESFEYQLSDSSDLASSLPSCTSTDRIGISGTDHIVTSTSAIHSNVYVSKSNRALVNKHNPLVYLSSAKTGARNITRSPVDFREGRRASDGLVAQQLNQADATNNVIAFNSQKLSENTKAKGVLELHLVQKEAKKLKTQYQANVPMEEVMQMQKQHTQYLHLGEKPRIPKRISLPDNFNYIPSTSVSCSNSVETETVSKPPLQQLMQHRLLQQKRQILQKQCAMSHQSPNASVESSSHQLNLSRRQMLRQASYKLAQQTQILPPLPLSDSESKDLMAFQAIVEGSVTKDTSVPYRTSVATDNWNNLPNSLQTSCQISDLGTASNIAWQQSTYTAPTTWNQVPNF